MSRGAPRVVVLHGYGSSPSRNWFPWLRLELASSGIEVSVPHLPDPAHPRVGAWCDAARTAIGSPDAELVVVGHSLGTATALRALDGIAGPWTLGGLILVAGFDRPLPRYPELDDFTTPSLDYRSLATRILERHIFVSTNDPDVPPEITRGLARRLAATLHPVNNAGHFLGSDGYVRMPLVAELARGILGLGGASISTSGHR